MLNKIKTYLTVGIIIFLFIFICWSDIKSPIVKKEKKHECTIFVKYKEHYQITPLSWNYRDSFKCVECKRDYKK